MRGPGKVLLRQVLGPVKDPESLFSATLFLAVLPFEKLKINIHLLCFLCSLRYSSDSVLANEVCDICLEASRSTFTS